MNTENDDELRRLEAEREAGQKLHDFNAELTGIASGRMSRFLPPDHTSNQEGRERRAEKARLRMSALEALLAADPAYAALYHETFDKLRDAERRTEAAINRAMETLEQTGHDLADTLDKANTLPDGRKVFRDPASGTVYDQNGNVVTGDELDAVVWRDDAPTWQDYRDKQQADRDARERLDALRRFQDKLGGHRNRLEDDSKPITAPEIQEIQDDIDAEMDALNLARDAARNNAAVAPTAEAKLPPPNT